MTSRLSPDRVIQTVIHHYPWSVLWLLACLAAVAVVRGSWTTTALVLVLILIVLLHSAHMTRDDRRTPGGRP